MTDLMQKALATIRTWTAERQNEAAEMLLALDQLGDGAYRASDDELRAVDAALADVQQGDLASDAEIKAAFARFRK